MKQLTKLTLIISISFLTMILAGTTIAGNDDQTALYAKLLLQYVNGKQVDYTGFKEKETQLDTYLDYLAKTNPAPMEDFGMDRLSGYAKYSQNVTK